MNATRLTHVTKPTRRTSIGAPLNERLGALHNCSDPEVPCLGRATTRSTQNTWFRILSALSRASRGERTRTVGLVVANDALYQLSYTPSCFLLRHLSPLRGAECGGVRRDRRFANMAPIIHGTRNRLVAPFASALQSTCAVESSPSLAIG